MNTLGTERPAKVSTKGPEEVVEQLQRALLSRQDIDQAKGILIAMHCIDGAAAWQLLNRASQNSNIKLRRLAVALVTIASGRSCDDVAAVSVVLDLVPPGNPLAGGTRLDARDRRLLGDVQDSLAADRDAAAADRDAVAEVRDQVAAREQVVAAAAADRAASGRDREDAAIDRKIAAEDRAAAQREQRRR